VCRCSSQEQVQGQKSPRRGVASSAVCLERDEFLPFVGFLNMTVKLRGEREREKGTDSCCACVCVVVLQRKVGDGRKKERKKRPPPRCMKWLRTQLFLLRSTQPTLGSPWSTQPTLQFLCTYRLMLTVNAFDRERPRVLIKLAEEFT